MSSIVKRGIVYWQKKGIKNLMLTIKLFTYVSIPDAHGKPKISDVMHYRDWI